MGPPVGGVGFGGLSSGKGLDGGGASGSGGGLSGVGMLHGVKSPKRSEDLVGK
jgi:hypothetical protein